MHPHLGRGWGGAYLPLGEGLGWGHSYFRNMGTFHNRPELRAFRKELRNEGTAAEATLWTCLKKRQLEGRKFRRQHSIARHIILDFYCPEERLAVELDGQHHFEPVGAANDEVRDEFLRRNMIRVVRFENREVFEDIERVLNGIKAQFRK